VHFLQFFRDFCNFFAIFTVNFVVIWHSTRCRFLKFHELAFHELAFHELAFHKLAFHELSFHELL
jgi:hypothetical protein